MEITHPDEELFDGAGATKRDLADYLTAVADRMVPELAGRPLQVCMEMASGELSISY